MVEDRWRKLRIVSLCLIAVAGLLAAVVAHRQIGLWTGSKGVVVAHAGESCLELIRLLGPGVSAGTIYLAWRTIKRQDRAISQNLISDWRTTVAVEGRSDRIALLKAASPLIVLCIAILAFMAYSVVADFAHHARESNDLDRARIEEARKAIPENPISD